MAETFLSPVINKLGDLLAEQANLLNGVQKEVSSLKDELEIIQPFVKDAEAKLSKREVSEAVMVWLKQLRDEADRIEDIIDEYLYHLAKRHHERGFIDSLRKAGDCFRSLKGRHDIASEIQYIKKSLSEILERGLSYGLRPLEQELSSSTVTKVDASGVDPQLGSLFIEEEELVGIDSTFKEVIRSLVEGPSTRLVISLIGLGGIGKTTLAKKAFKDDAVRQHFEFFAWITVSQSYNMEKVLKSMKNQICQENEDTSGTIEELIEFLRHYLKKKRYVVVFDDVWTIDFWQVIKHAMPSNNTRARIIITTRISALASAVKDTSYDHIHELKAWSPQLSWALFCKKAFHFEFDGCCPKELEQLSHDIVSICQGLPLLIAVVAGLLSKKEKTKLEWQRLLDNLNYAIKRNPCLSAVSEILSFSYHDLPYHLRSCFLYFGIFPEDYSVLDERLCRLWISEDFIVKSKGNKTLEQVAEEYLSDLIQRNLVSFEIENGVYRMCRVHDLIRDMLTGIDEGFNSCHIVSHENKLRVEEKSRRLSIHGTTKDVLNLIRDDSKIRSILLFNIDELNESFVIHLVTKCKLLKVLDFENAPLHNIPKEIGYLFNLKYLNLKGTPVKMVPKSIGKLQNLQTFNLDQSLVQELPIEIQKLRHLRHLEVEPIVSTYSCDLDHGVRIHEGIGSLEELQTLTSLRAYPITFDLKKELERLRQLRILSIYQVSAETDKAIGASIEKMNHLEELSLKAVNEDDILDLNCISSPPPLLRYFQLCCRLHKLPNWMSKLQNLQGLDLFLSRLTNDPLKILKELPNLAFLGMYQTYDGEELHFEEDGFRKLKHLILRKLEGLRVVKIDRRALPRLEKLRFGPFPQMKKMPSDILHLTNLISLEIVDMPREFVIGLQPDGGPDYLKIEHVPSVIFWYKRKWRIYNSYKLGAPDLLELLQEQATSSIYDLALK
ncbi:NB-ARC domain, LRR domain containing protein [Parasponia andersonii]|uniref:NB-ARC domain, LRR domain containing protein n=1 Tax=Parasponia andersonii TaxID=3476 RepID=A0A2P5DYJ3_PARAD|nr:NB-ARC domain, LRR domain containing protein [Parasponia andersonii]